MRTARHDVVHAAGAEHLLQPLAHPAGEEIGGGVAVAELQHGQPPRGEEIGLEFAIGGEFAGSAAPGCRQRRLERRQRADAAGAAERGEIGVRHRRLRHHRRAQQLVAGGAGRRDGAHGRLRRPAAAGVAPGVETWVGSGERDELRGRPAAAAGSPIAATGRSRRRRSSGALTSIFAVRVAPTAPISRADAQASSATELRKPYFAPICSHSAATSRPRCFRLSRIAG